MNTKLTPNQATLQEATVILAFAPDVSRRDALRIISRMDLAAFPRIKDLAAVSFFTTYKGEVKASLIYLVECPWTEDVRPILESFIDSEAYGPEIAGAVTGHRVIGATRV